MKQKTIPVTPKSSSNKTSTVKVEFVFAKPFKFKANGKYLIVMPKDAKLDKIAPAIGRFFEPAKVFVLAVNEVNSIKITELLEENK